MVLIGLDEQDPGPISGLLLIYLEYETTPLQSPVSQSILMIKVAFNLKFSMNCSLH